MNKTAAFLAAALILCSWIQAGFPGAAFSREKEMLFARVSLNMDWKIEESEGIDEGFLILNLSGPLKLNRAFSSAAEGLPSVFIPYTVSGMKGGYKYESKFYANDPGDCQNPVDSFSGVGMFMVEPIESPGNLLVYTLGSFAEGVGLFGMTPTEAAGVLTDHYDFFLPLPEQEAPGTAVVQTDPCRKERGTVPFLGGTLEIRFEHTDEGGMSGKRSWSAEGPEGYAIKVSDLPPVFNAEPFQPEESKVGEVNYRLSWEISDLPMVQILQNVNGYWLDITNGTREAVVGDKIELKAAVMPEELDSGSGRWTIEDGGSKKIKEFNASTEKGEVIPFDEGELGSREILFHWVDGKKAKITYRTQAGGETITGEAEFEIKRPKFNFSTLARTTNNLQEMTLGLPLGGECCGSPEFEKVKEECLELKKAAETSNDPWDRKIYEDTCEIEGLQYSGITFEATPKDDTPGEVQFVQLVTRTITFIDNQAGGDIDRKSDPLALDGCYPYPRTSAYTARDMPAFAVRGGSTYEERDLLFDMYLMFRSYEDDSQWVPLKVVDWHWKGAVRCDNGNCGEFKQNEVFPRSKPGRDTTDYPEWDSCSN